MTYHHFLSSYYYFTPVSYTHLVAGTFKGFAADKAGEVTKFVANGAVATTSMLFIIEAVALGFFLKYSKFNKWINTLVAIALLIVAIALGLNFPMYLNLRDVYKRQS